LTANPGGLVLAAPFEEAPSAIGLTWTMGIRFNALLVTPADNS
jgi:hypothetical protein